MIIYKTTNLINGKIYIGKDTKNNKNYLGSGKLLKNAIKKYGENNFSKEILEHCQDADKLDEREKFWIKEFNSIQNGYNLTEGGTGGDTFSKNNDKEKIREKLKKRVFSDDVIKKRCENLKPFQSKENHPNFGKKQSELTKEKRKKTFLINGFPMSNKFHSEETIKKMSEIKKGTILSDETKRKISSSNKGIKKKLIECPFCGKFGGQPQMIQWHFDNCKYKNND